MEGLALQLSALQSVKDTFYVDHRDKPDHEIERLWREHWALLTRKLGATPTDAHPLPSTKRPRSRTGEPGMEARPTRRSRNSV